MINEIINNILDNKVEQFKNNMNKVDNKVKVNTTELLIQYILSNDITEDNGLLMLYIIINNDLSILKFKEIINLSLKIKKNKSKINKVKKLFSYFQKISSINNKFLSNIRNLKITNGSINNYFEKGINESKFIGIIILKILPLLQSHYDKTFIKNAKIWIMKNNDDLNYNNDMKYFYEKELLDRILSLVNIFGYNLLKFYRIPVIGKETYDDFSLTDKVSYFEECCRTLIKSFTELKDNHIELNELNKSIEKLILEAQKNNIPLKISLEEDNFNPNISYPKYDKEIYDSSDSSDSEDDIDFSFISNIISVKTEPDNNDIQPYIQDLVQDIINKAIENIN